LQERANIGHFGRVQTVVVKTKVVRAEVVGDDEDDVLLGVNGRDEYGEEKGETVF